MTVSEAFNLYRLDCIVFPNLSSKTEGNHNAARRWLIDYVGDIEVDTLTFEMVRDWKIWLSKGRDTNTVREYVIRLRMVLRHLHARGFNCLNYASIGVPKRVNRTPTFLTPKEVDSLIEDVFKPRQGCSKINRYRNRALLSLLYSSGIRANELLLLNRTDIQEDNTFTVYGKGDKPRLCFVDQRTVHYLREYLALRRDNCDALFASGGKRLSRSALQRLFVMLRSINPIAEQKKVHAHIMRHSFATDLLRNKANIRVVQEFLGHASIETTQIYTHVVNEDLRLAYIQSHST